MTHPLLLLTTCGTSLLTHGADPETRRWLVEIANKERLPETEGQRLSDHVDSCRERLLRADGVQRSRLSAELNSIQAVLQQQPTPHVQHALVHTDTAVGQATARIVAAALEQEGHAVSLLTAAGLRTDRLPLFREELGELTQKLEQWTTGYRTRGWTVIFNLTGGFKSVNAYLQAIGMLYADRCVFLFEGSPALLEIPRLPVKLAEAEELRAHQKAFRQIASGYPLPAEAARGIPDALILAVGDKAYLSVWGELVWGRIRKTLLAEISPADILSRKLVVGGQVCELIVSLPAETRVEINEALDLLSAYLDHGRPLPKSHSFETLQHNPSPPATYELRTSRGTDSWRLLGHFAEDDFVVDTLVRTP